MGSYRGAIGEVKQGRQPMMLIVSNFSAIIVCRNILSQASKAHHYSPIIFRSSLPSDAGFAFCAISFHIHLIMYLIPRSPPSLPHTFVLGTCPDEILSIHTLPMFNIYEHVITALDCLFLGGVVSSNILQSGEVYISTYQMGGF